MKARTILVTGGVRSGKSRFAQELAGQIAGGRPVLYLATSQEDPTDPSLAERISRHRRNRPAGWITVAAPYDLPEVVLELNGPVSAGQDSRLAAARGCPVLLIDCLTVWAANCLALAGDAGTTEFVSRAATAFEPRLCRLCDSIASLDRPAVLVTNEVGMGVAPPTLLGNVFADIHGEMNQRVAALASELYLVVAGVPLRVK